MPKIVIAQQRRGYGLVEPPEIGGWTSLERVSLINKDEQRVVTGYLAEILDYYDLMTLIAYVGCDREATIRVDAYESVDGMATYPLLMLRQGR